MAGRIKREQGISLGVLESRFADLIWDREPIPSGELVKLTAQEFGWTKSTMYTVLKRLAAKGLFINDNGTVRASVSRDEYRALRSDGFLDEVFGGSLPAMVASFAARRPLSREDAEELKKMIDDFTEKQK